MPIPIVVAAAAAAEMTAAAEFVSVVMTSTLVLTTLSDIMDNDKAEEEEAEKEVALADSSRPCKECPAIEKVTPEEEIFSGADINLRYQSRICETSFYRTEGKTYILGFVFSDSSLLNTKWRVSFDGWKPKRCLFLEAKGQYDQFFDKNGEPWFHGSKGLVLQAIRQQDVINICGGIPKCHWHFMQPVSYAYYKRSFNQYKGITVFYSP